MKIEPHSYYPSSAPEMRDVGAPQTLAQWRHNGKGPAYIKSGSRFLYLGQDVLNWLDKNRVNPDAAE